MTTSKKSAEPPHVADGVEVTFARPWSVGGYDYDADQTVTLDRGDADEVLRLGYARPSGTREV